jgi:putative GTP pyrophosphokinase
MTAVLKPFSNNQIDMLGERLKVGDPSDEDVTMLSAYRNSFYDAAKSVADTVREISGLEVTARPLKTTLSIVAKLKRDGVKQLSAMQDIGGCRVTVSNLTAQDDLIGKLMAAFPDAKLYDRVAKPSHGYRAKHLVVKVDGRRIEIQVRTYLQNHWALISERAADVFGQEIKYGLGNEGMRQQMLLMSRFFQLAENRQYEPSMELRSTLHEQLERLNKAISGMKNDLLH